MPCSISFSISCPVLLPFNLLDRSFPAFVISVSYLLVDLWLPSPYATCSLPHIPVLSLSSYFCSRKALYLHILLFLMASLHCFISYRVTSEGIQHLSLAVLPLPSHLTQSFLTSGQGLLLSWASWYSGFPFEMSLQPCQPQKYHPVVGCPPLLSEA